MLPVSHESKPRRRAFTCLLSCLVLPFILYVLAAGLAIIYSLSHPLNVQPASCPEPEWIVLPECPVSWGELKAIINVPPTVFGPAPLPLLLFGVGCCGRLVEDYDWLASLPAIVVRIDQNPYTIMPLDQPMQTSALVCAAKATLARLSGIADPAAIFVGGHSMGGGLAFDAAKELVLRERLPVRGLIVLSPAAYTYQPLAACAAAMPHVPILAVGATADCVHPVALDTWTAFNATAAERRALVVLLGAHHCHTGAFPACPSVPCPAACHQMGAQAAKERLLEVIASFIEALGPRETARSEQPPPVQQGRADARGEGARGEEARGEGASGSWAAFERRLSEGTASGRWSSFTATEMRRGGPSAGARYQAHLAASSCPMLDPCGAAAPRDAGGLTLTESIVLNTVSHRLQGYAITACQMDQARSVYAEEQPLHRLLEISHPDEMRSCTVELTPSGVPVDLVRDGTLVHRFIRWCTQQASCGLRSILIFIGRALPVPDSTVSIGMTSRGASYSTR